MDKKHFEFLEAMQQVDDKWILEAGEPWKIKKTVDEKKEYVRFAVTAKAACILLVLVLGVSCIFHEQVKAAITQALTRIGQWMGNENDLSPYVEEVMQSQTIDGITMNLKEILLGKDRITVCVSNEGGCIDSNQKMISFGGISINGKDLKCISVDVYEQGDPMEFVLEYNCEKDALPEEIQKIKIVISYYEIGKEELIKYFEFTVYPEKEEFKEQSIEQNLDINMEDEGGQVFHLKEYTYNRVEGQIRVLCDKDPRKYMSDELEDMGAYELDYGIVIEDDQGNDCNFEPIYYDEREGEIWFKSEFGTQPWEKSKYIDVRFYTDTISHDGTARPSRLVGEKRIEFGEKGEKE